MGKNSAIEWTDHTFNAWIGCEKVSPGCKLCYAERYGNRFSIGWGNPYRRTSVGYWADARSWVRRYCAPCLHDSRSAPEIGAPKLRRRAVRVTWLTTLLDGEVPA